MRGEGTPFGWRAKGVPSPLKLPPSSPKRAFFRRMGSAEARTSPLIRRLPVLQAICLPYGLSLYGKSVFFPQNDRPYGFLYEASQNVRETVAARKACVFPYCFIFPIKRAGEGMGGLGGRETPLAPAATEGGRRPCPLRRRKLRASTAEMRGFPSPKQLTNSANRL